MTIIIMFIVCSQSQLFRRTLVVGARHKHPKRSIDIGGTYPPPPIGYPGSATGSHNYEWSTKSKIGQTNIIK